MRAISKFYAGLLASSLIGAAGPLIAAERIEMPLGALVCKTIEPTIEHARIVRQPTTAGLREFVEAQVARGMCRQIKSPTTVGVVDVDQRGFALVDDGQGAHWWTDAEKVWGYFDTPKRVKAWKKGQ